MLSVIKLRGLHSLQDHEYFEATLDYGNDQDVSYTYVRNNNSLLKYSKTTEPQYIPCTSNEETLQKVQKSIHSS